jgi:VanZ family protein
VKPDTKEEQRPNLAGAFFHSPALAFAVLIALVYFWGTALFSYEHSTQAIRWILNAIRHGGSESQVTFLNACLRWSAHYLQFFMVFLALAVWPLRMRPLSALIVTLTLAAADEGHQHFVPERDCGLFDLELDWAGAASAMLLVLAIRRWRRDGRPSPAISATGADRISA